MRDYRLVEAEARLYSRLEEVGLLDRRPRQVENYGTLQHPFYFTPSLCLPFLICEAKTGRSGIDLADTQNIHVGIHVNIDPNNLKDLS